MHVPTRILVVDESSDYRTTLCDVLASEGFECKAVDSAGDAIAVFHDFGPDVVLAELELSGADVLLRVIEQLRRDRARSVGFVAMSSQASPRARSVADAVVDKLSEPCEVVRAIRFAMDSAHARVQT